MVNFSHTIPFFQVLTPIQSLLVFFILSSALRICVRVRVRMRALVLCQELLSVGGSIQ